jgi:hypothetical protein
LLLNDHSKVKQKLFHVTCCKKSRVFCEPPTAIHCIVCALIFPHAHLLFSLNVSVSLLHSHECVWQAVTSRLVLSKVCTLDVALWNHVTLHCVWFDTLSLTISQCLHRPPSCNHSNKSVTYLWEYYWKLFLDILLSILFKEFKRITENPWLYFAKVGYLKHFLKYEAYY